MGGGGGRGGGGGSPTQAGGGCDGVNYPMSRQQRPQD